MVSALILVLVPLLFMYCYFFKPKLKIWYIAVAYLGIYFVTIVTHTRELAVDANFWNSLQEVIRESEPIKDLCLEMGGTVKAPMYYVERVRFFYSGFYFLCFLWRLYIT